MGTRFEVLDRVGTRFEVLDRVGTRYKALERVGMRSDAHLHLQEMLKRFRIISQLFLSEIDRRA